MPATITFTVTQGSLPRSAYVFAERTTCLVGRDAECDPLVPDDDEHRSISRLHCLLDINPPDLRIRDLGSLFGTFVNGVKIGQREREEQRGKALFPEHDLKHGDEVRLGNPDNGETIAFRVAVVVPARCSGCNAEVPEEEKPRAEKAPGVFQCAACRQQAETGPWLSPLRQKARACARCGKDVSAEVGNLRQGEFVCAARKADPLAIVSRLLDLARSGQKDLLAIQGYRIERLLGKGGMGAVYLVRHEKTSERVALKVMLPPVAADALATARFLREVELTRALEHDNIVRLRESGCSGGTFFFTLDYCDGGSVADLLSARGGRLSVDESANIALQALAGLEHAHQAEVSVTLVDGSTAKANGLVHRDLSPGNLFLAGQGTGAVVKVGDFGLAHAFDLAGLSGQTRTGTAAGKPTFMPRQQVVNFKYARPEVDVWAVAACFYYMVTGQPPRDFPESECPWLAVLKTSAVPIRERERGKDVPEALARVIDQALVDKPAIGYKTAAELRRALESAL